MWIASQKHSAPFKPSHAVTPSHRKSIRPVQILRQKPRGLQALIIAMARELVDAPAAVSVSEIEGVGCVILSLSVAKEDIGKIIGRHGRTAQALRVILNAVAAREKKHVVLEIVE